MRCIQSLVCWRRESYQKQNHNCIPKKEGRMRTFPNPSLTRVELKIDILWVTNCRMAGTLYAYDIVFLHDCNRENLLG